MAEQIQPTNYTQGHSACTIAVHQTRTAESDAAFLLPYIKKTDNILDLGCGPGTITTGLAKYASQGRIVGVDISTAVLTKARALAAEANISTEGLGSVIFEEGDILKGLSYPDETFDIVFCCQVFGHLEPRERSIRAMVEMRRLLKPNGILATRDAAAHHFYPRRLNLDKLWVHNNRRVMRKGMPEDADSTGMAMPTLFRQGGFDVDGGKVRVGAGSTVFSGAESRKWLAWRVNGQLKKDDTFRQSWLEAGITEDEIEQTLSAVNEWAETEDGWYVSIQCEMLGWK